MPTYTMPRPNTQSTDNWAEAAKMFLQSPTFANQYMQDANAAMQAPEQSLRPEARPFSDIEGLSERDLLAGALTGEGGSVEDMRYITDVINNRVQAGRWGDSLSDVILAPGQFSAFNTVTGYAGGEGGNDHWRRPSADAYRVADAYLSGQLPPNLTGGALNYYQPELSDPKWGGDHFRALPGSTHVFGTAR